jgi:asparagine synthase (glutamine-hydrolysing)
MCGLAGIARREARGVTVETLDRMAAALRHRGPDGYGRYGGARVGLAHVRLSIIDVAGGAQPLSNEDGRLWVICNGEIYNHVELRQELEGRGHRFQTRSDTEVLVHGYEEWGVRMLERLHGQFAFAIHDRQGDTVFLARDRFGVRPLFYSEQRGDVLFASEVKALFASGEVRAAPDLQGLDEVFTFWAARPPRTVFAGVQSLEPGCFAVWRDGRLRVQRYYTLAYPEARAESPNAVAELDELLHASVAERLRADVPVGGYLSGGLDSSITCALAGALTPHRLRTFSVTFDDPQLDERTFQQLVARELRTDHAVQAIGPGDIAAAFPEVVRHTETPLVRTAPAPMYLLSRLVRKQGIKVVLTGEGSDELFLGYDLFKETAVRMFCLRQPQSRWRPRLFERLYPYLDARGRRGDFWQRSFLDAGSPADPLFSHLPRFQLTARIKDFYSGEMRVETRGFDALAELRATLPAEFPSWAPLHRAAYLEMVTLLSPYLLSSQGDRMAMAHAVEGRFPFLDHRLFEFAARLPTGSKLRGLREKDILRRWAAAVVPQPVAERPKQPYRAPDVPAFFAPELVGYARELLDKRAVQDSGIFDPAAVAGLLGRCRKGAALGFRENQAFVAILSTQLWYQHFIDSTAPWRGAAAPEPDIAVAERASAQG